MHQIIKSIGIQLLFLVWVFSSMNTHANDPVKKESFSWRLTLKGDNPTTYTGTFTSNLVRDRSGIVDSDGRDVSNVCCSCSSYDYQVFRAESRMTLQSDSALPPPERTPFWLFSQPSPSGMFQTTARQTLRGQTSECISFGELYGECREICDECCGQHGENAEAEFLGSVTDRILSGVCCFPWLMWYALYVYRTDLRRVRRPHLEAATPERTGGYISISDVSLAGRAGSIETPPSSMPASTRVIHLVENDHETQRWLQQIINGAGLIESSVVVIPGFLHTPTRVSMSFISSNGLNQQHTVFLRSDHPEINRITIMVSPAEQRVLNYRIDGIQFNGENVILTINRLPEVVRSQPQPSNAGDQQGASFLPETVEQGAPPLNGQNAFLSGSFSEAAGNHQEIVRMSTLPLPLNEK